MPSAHCFHEGCERAQGEPWGSAIVGHEINPVEQQEEQKRLMLERFQVEVISGFCCCWYSVAPTLS